MGICPWNLVAYVTGGLLFNVKQIIIGFSPWQTQIKWDRAPGGGGGGVLGIYIGGGVPWHTKKGGS